MHQMDHRRLGRRIGVAGDRSGHHARYRACHDDATALARLHHGGGGLHGGEHAGLVDLEDVVPCGQIDILDLSLGLREGRTAGNARVATANIKLAVFRDNLVDGLANAQGVAHVKLDAFRVEARLRQTANRATQVFGVNIRHDHDRALFGECFRHGEAKATRGAGDEGDPAGQIEKIDGHFGCSGNVPMRGIVSTSASKRSSEANESMMP